MTSTSLAGVVVSICLLGTAAYAQTQSTPTVYTPGNGVTSPRLVRPEVQDSLSPEVRAILALDDPLNDELSAQTVVRSGFLK